MKCLLLLLQGTAAILPATALLSAPAQATHAASAPTADAAQAARCISEHLPHGAQVFQAGGGAYRVVAFDLRGQSARWTIRPAADSLQVTRNGGPARIDRALKGVCY